MPDVKIEIQGLKEALAALQVPEGELPMKIADAIAQEVVLPRLREYPSASRATQPFKSAKSRRFFFAALRSGEITIPYRRTQALAALWEVKNTSLSSVEVVSRRPKSDLIIGSGNKQARYHRGTWPNVDQVAEDSVPEAIDMANRIAREYLDRAGLS